MSKAKQFKALRKQHSLESAEDYTELIHELIEKNGEARTGVIARELGISHVTALRTIKRLQEQGYVTTARQKPVELTAKGKKLALYSKEKHEILLEFLVKLGVPKKVADIDVEGIEHHVSKITLDRIKHFLKN